MHITSAKRLLSTLAAGTLALASAAAFAQPASTPAKPATPATTPAKENAGDKDSKTTKKDGAKHDEKSAGATIGAPAPDFTLRDLDGKEHSLAALTKSGKIVVLQWFNPECPFVVKHYGENTTFNDMATKYKGKDVVILAINSGAPGKQGVGKERNAKAVKDWKIAYPVLLDESGEIGRKYGAKNTPAMYVIAKDGTLAYTGAIDDDSGADKPGKTNYVTKAVDELLAGTNVSQATTKPYGCSVKY